MRSSARAERAEGGYVGRALQVLVRWKGLHADQCAMADVAPSGWQCKLQPGHQDGGQGDGEAQVSAEGAAPGAEAPSKGCGGQVAPPARGAGSPRRRPYVGGCRWLTEGGCRWTVGLAPRSPWAPRPRGCTEGELAEVREVCPSCGSHRGRTSFGAACGRSRASGWGAGCRELGAGPRKRRGSGLADEGLAKKRKEGRT